jgi:hypothetical protein
MILVVGSAPKVWITNRPEDAEAFRAVIILLAPSRPGAFF